MTKSILSNEKKCFLCGSQTALERHHIYEGGLRKSSEKHGCWVWLCHGCHQGYGGIRHNPIKEDDLFLKKQAQIEFEKERSHEEFMKIFRRNWI